MQFCAVMSRVLCSFVQFNLGTEIKIGQVLCSPVFGNQTSLGLLSSLSRPHVPCYFGYYADHSSTAPSGPLLHGKSRARSCHNQISRCRFQVGSEYKHIAFMYSDAGCVARGSYVYLVLPGSAAAERRALRELLVVRHESLLSLSLSFWLAWVGFASPAASLASRSWLSSSVASQSAPALSVVRTLPSPVL